MDCDECIVDCCGNDDVWNADTSCDDDRAARMQSVVVSLIIFYIFDCYFCVFVVCLKIDTMLYLLQI